MPQIKPDVETFARIRVVGVGGSGGSAIHRMMASRIPPARVKPLEIGGIRYEAVWGSMGLFRAFEIGKQNQACSVRFLDRLRVPS